MDSTFDMFPKAFDSLEPPMRAKAFEVAKQLMKTEGKSENEAISQAIVFAEEWYHELEE